MENDRLLAFGLADSGTPKMGAAMFTRMAYPDFTDRRASYGLRLHGALLFHVTANGSRGLEEPFDDEEERAASAAMGHPAINQHFARRIEKRIMMAHQTIATVAARAGLPMNDPDQWAGKPISVALDRIMTVTGEPDERAVRRDYWQQTFPVLHLAIAFAYLVQPMMRKEQSVGVPDLLTNPTFVDAWAKLSMLFRAVVADEWPDQTEELSQLTVVAV